MNQPIDQDKIFFSGYCPACRAGRARINKTDRPLQYASCPKCGVRWKILSVNLFLEDALQQAAALDERARVIKEKYNFLTHSR